MARGYQTDELKQKLVELLEQSKTGLSGVEVAERLGVNRITMTKYLNVFAAEGLIQQKNIGNVTLWFVEEGTEQYQFPDDYFAVKEKYMESLLAKSENQVYNLIRNCLHSDAKISNLIMEVIIPAIDSVQNLFDEGKIETSEKKLLENIISTSLRSINLLAMHSTPDKNVAIISTGNKSNLLADAASALFHSDGWQVFLLGDMSSAIDILFDLDWEKFLTKTWKPKTGVMIVLVISDSEENLKFFADTINSSKEKFGKNLRLILSGNVGKKSSIESDLTTANLPDALQWSQTVFESLQS